MIAFREIQCYGKNGHVTGLNPGKQSSADVKVELLLELTLSIITIVCGDSEPQASALQLQRTPGVAGHVTLTPLESCLARRTIRSKNSKNLWISRRRLVEAEVGKHGPPQPKLTKASDQQKIGPFTGQTHPSRWKEDHPNRKERSCLSRELAYSSD